MKRGWKIFWIVCGSAILTGFVCCAIALGLGVTLDSLHSRFPYGIGFVADDGGRSAENIHESFGGVTEIDAELFAGDVSVLSTDGDEIRVDTDNLSKRLGFKCYTEGNELKLRTNKKLFRVNNLGKGTINIYIPRKMKLEEAAFDMGAGALYIEDICAGSLNVNMGAGEVNISAFQAYEAEFECGAGSICAIGDIGSQIDISCGVGEVQYTASGNEKEYNYIISCGVGEVVCGGSDYSGINGNKEIDNGAAKEMDISTGVGSVIIDFGGTETNYGTKTHHEEHE